MSHYQTSCSGRHRTHRIIKSSVPLNSNPLIPLTLLGHSERILRSHRLGQHANAREIAVCMYQTEHKLCKEWGGRYLEILVLLYMFTLLSTLDQTDGIRHLKFSTYVHYFFEKGVVGLECCQNHNKQTNKTLDSGSSLELNSNFGGIRILFWAELIFFKNKGGKSYFLHELSNNLKWSNLLRSFLQHQTANFKWTNSQHTLIMLSGHMFSFCNHQNRTQ